MNNIITISRQFGSGGRLIGKKLAEKLGIPFYDREIIDETAKILGMDAEYVKEKEEKLKLTNFLGFFSDTMLYNSPTQAMPTLESQIYFLECEVIKDFANKGDCVIVGRCADYILKNKHNCLNVFVHANIGQRKLRISNIYKIEEDTDKKLEKLVIKNDKSRAKHYFFYTDQVWGSCDNYNLTIDSHAFGIDKSVEVIKTAFDIMKQN